MDYKQVDFRILERKEPVVCDTHPKEIAQAACLGKKMFLCVECVIDKAKEPGRIITKLDKIRDEKDKALFDCMYERQQVRNLLNARLEYERKALKIKENVTEEVLQFHKKLSDKLDEMKTKTLRKIEEMTKCVLETPLKDKSKLNELESNIEEAMKLLEEETDNATSKVSTTIMNVHTSLNKDVANLTSEPSKIVQLYESLEKALDQQNGLLANVSIYAPDTYEEIGNANSGDDEPDKSKKSEMSSSLPRQEEKENIKGDGKGKENGNTGKTKEKEPASLQGNNENIAPEEQIYQDVTTFEKTVNIHPKHLLNTFLQLSSLDSRFSSACKFTKIVYLGEGRMAMLSKVHSLVVVVGLDDTHTCSMSFKTPIHNIAALNKDTVAVLSNTQVIKYQVGNTSFQACGAIQIDKKDFTGFDYDQKKSQFALSSEERLSVIDNLGGNKEDYTFPKRGSGGEIITAYDFDNGNVCFIDKKRQALGCYSVKGKKDVFKTKRFDFLVRDLYVGNGILCISSESAVYLFSSSDGKAMVRHELDDLVVNCSAVCETDGIIIVASDSDDLEKSKRIGFISVK